MTDRVVSSSAGTSGCVEDDRKWRRVAKIEVEQSNLKEDREKEPPSRRVIYFEAIGFPVQSKDRQQSSSALDLAKKPQNLYAE